MTSLLLSLSLTLVITRSRVLSLHFRIALFSLMEMHSLFSMKISPSHDSLPIYTCTFLHRKPRHNWPVIETCTLMYSTLSTKALLERYCFILLSPLCFSLYLSFWFSLWLSLWTCLCLESRLSLSLKASCCECLAICLSLYALTNCLRMRLPSPFMSS